MDLQEVPKNDLLRTAFHAYQISYQTKSLKSEKYRTISAENFETIKPLPLSTICLKIIAENYKGRPIYQDLKPIQLRTFYDYIDSNLPLERCINIVDEYFWKRVYAMKCADKMLLKEKNSQKDVSWKDLVVTMKYADIIENTSYEAWMSDEMESITKMVSPHVTELKINKIQARSETSFRKQFLVSEDSKVTMGTSEEKTVIEVTDEEETSGGLQQETGEEYNYPIEDCHHVDLSVFKHLRQLHSITIEFLPPGLGTNYHSRYFDFSYYDMQNLASGISELDNLKVLKIRRSRMDYVKLSTLVEVLKTMSVEELEFYFCKLDDECGESFYEFLISCNTLKKLNLSGNYFKNFAIESISDGIKNSDSELTFLALSNNPIQDDYICVLVNVLLLCEELVNLKLSGINMSEKGSTCVANLIKNHPKLKELEIVAVAMDGHSLVDAMQANMTIQQLLCQGCGLSLEDEFKIELLLKRNRFIEKNPYIGNTTKTEEEINEFVTRIKNPVLCNALANIKARMECLQNRPERDESSVAATVTSLSKKHKDFNFEPTKFTEEELCQRVSLFAQKRENFFEQKNTK